MVLLIKEIPLSIMLLSQQFSQEQLQLLLNWETELEETNWPIIKVRSGPIKLMIYTQT